MKSKSFLITAAAMLAFAGATFAAETVAPATTEPVKTTEPAKPAEKPDAKPDEKVKPYTLTVCPVSDEKLGEMGDPVVFNYEGREIKLCCKKCRKGFDKDPAKFIKKIEEAEKAAPAKPETERLKKD